jgi:hypothetical protein
VNSLLQTGKKKSCFCNPRTSSAGIGISRRARLLVYCIHTEQMRNRAMGKLMSTLRRFFAAKPEENSAQRIIESILPVASLYGVDIANIDPEWFHEQTQR